MKPVKCKNLLTITNKSHHCSSVSRYPAKRIDVLHAARTAPPARAAAGRPETSPLQAQVIEVID